MAAAQTVLVFGAYGHTGRFVVAELHGRGFLPRLSGRDADRLRRLAETWPGLEVRPAAVDDAAALDRALEGAAAVVNCAGPFASTATPLVEAALRAGVPYVDVAAEVEAVLDTLTRFDAPARAAGCAVVPAMAFYGGLGDLLVTVAMGDWTAADEAHVAYALSSWHPTPGTRASGRVSRARRGGRRVRYTQGRLEYRDDEPPVLDWLFPEPLGARTVVGEFTTADVVTLTRHLTIPEVGMYMTRGAVHDVTSADTPAPIPVDERGRSAQTFLVDVVVRRGGTRRHVVATGQDIYAVTAPLAAEAVQRLLDGRGRRLGAVGAGEAFDAADVLAALSEHVSVDVLPG